MALPLSAGFILMYELFLKDLIDLYSPLVKFIFLDCLYFSLC